MKRRGNCYVTCEALYHLLGGKAAGLTPHTVRHDGDVHWYLVQDVYLDTSAGSSRRAALVLDPTRAQFKTAPPYHLGRGRGFLTREPSRRARDLMDRMVWQGNKPSAPRVLRTEGKPR